MQQMESIPAGNWRLYPDHRSLVNAEQSVSLDPKEFAVLEHLIARAPHTVTSSDLLQRHWHGRIVGDNALHRVIGRLRNALGDSSRRPRYIETIPRRGYRFVGNGLETARTRHTLLVVPFRALGDNSASDLAAGLEVECRAAFAGSPVLDLIDRPDGRAETALVRGSLRVHDRRLRVNLELVRGRGARVSWQHAWNASLEQVLGTQEQIATEALAGLEGALARAS